MAHCAADDAAEHIAAALVRGGDAVSDEERAGADMVGDDAERLVGQILVIVNDSSRILDEFPEEVDVVVRVNALQHSGHTLEAHSGVDVRARELRHGAVFLAVELGEHEVPDFHEAVAVLVGRSRRTALH